MLNIVYYATLAMIALLFFMSILVYKKIDVWKTLMLFLTIGLFVVWTFFEDLVGQISFDYLEEAYYLLLILILLMMAMTFRRKIKVTKNLTDYDFFELEKQLEEVNQTSELLRKRFIHSIDLLSEGLIFYESDYSGLYITDYAKNLIDTDQNQMDMETYLNLIHDDDQKSYLQTIKKLNEKVNVYEVKYRIRTKDTYAWIIEKGKLFKYNKKDHIIATMKPVNLKLFPDTMIDVLDSLPYEDDLTKTISSLSKNKQTFYLVMLHLTNIPDVNKRFGRDVGNMMIAEYVKNMRYHFAREKNTLFRITGIQFALVITDDLKYQNLHRALSSGGDLINLKLSIGGIQQIIYPNIGIVKHDPWSQMSINDLLSLSNKALEEAISDNKNNYSIFGGS